MTTQQLSESQRKFLEEATATYEEDLSARAPATMAYLEDRGISADLARKYRLGAVETPEPGHQQYKGMLAIPYLTPSGPIGMKFRHIGDRLPKYLASSNQGSHLYNVSALRSASTEISLCEGELDTIILDGAVGIPAVGVPGVTNWKPFYRRIFEGFSRVWVFADNDLKEDGSNPGQELIKTVSKGLPQAVLVALPVNQDVNDVYMEQGPEFLRSLVKK